MPLRCLFKTGHSIWLKKKLVLKILKKISKFVRKIEKPEVTIKPSKQLTL